MYTLLIVAFGALALAGLGVWWRERVQAARIRRLRAEAAAARYCANVCGNALTAITRMAYPGHTLRDAQNRARLALRALPQEAA